jgi:hypothetical protein
VATSSSESWGPGTDGDELPDRADLTPGHAEVYATAAAFYVACLKNGFIDEAQEFAEWFLEEFDLDLET